LLYVGLKMTTSEDFKLIEWAHEIESEYIIFKQLRNKDDLDFLIQLAPVKSKRIFCVQNKVGLTLFDECVQDCNAVILGRGTLALETSLAEVCRAQKEIVRVCNDLCKPVIVSTQLLESMVVNAAPTRSEVTDITNAVLDGADALLLTGETAYGVDPVRAFRACAQICVEAERFLNYDSRCEAVKQSLGKNITISENTCYAAVISVLALRARVIVCLTETGRTAQIISRFLPPCSIVALTDSQLTARQLRIVRGVHPFYVEEKGEEEIIQRIFGIVKEEKFAKEGELIVLVSGLCSVIDSGHSCSLKILTVK
jgi:pyruvate kinase